MTTIKRSDGSFGPPIGPDDFVAVEVEGARDDPEEALAALLTALEEVGIIIDSTEETAA
jgi:hypothetical protein